MGCDNSKSMPCGQLGIVALQSATKLGDSINKHLEDKNGKSETDSYLISTKETRFSNGEGKIVLSETVRGKDIYILCDVGNYSCTYDMFGFENRMGPDEHFQDIKRVVSAIGGRARRVTVVMPMIYAGRQHRRKERESLDCALALQELERLGVSDVVTFDVHDPNVQNAVPLISFDNIYPTYEIVKTYLRQEGNKNIDKDKMLVISPDTGAMDRAIYYSSVLGVDIGLFYKRRDHSTIVNGKNPIVQHEYLGKDVEGMNILIVDDMIASGESVFDIAKELKSRKAAKITVATTFALFTAGVEKFERYHKEGLIDKVYSTNLTYIPDYVKESEWFEEVDVSKFLAHIIYNLNQEKSIAPLMDATESIKKLLEK